MVPTEMVVMPSAPKRLLTVSFTFPVTACGMWHDEHEGSSLVARASIFNSSPPPAGSTLRWDGCSFLQRQCPLLAVRKTNTREERALHPASRQVQRRQMLFQRHAVQPDTLTHVVLTVVLTSFLKTNSLKSAVSEAELFEFHAYSCQAAHSSYRAGEQARFSRLPNSRATQGYRQRNNDPPRDCKWVAQNGPSSRWVAGKWYRPTPTASPQIACCACTSPAHLQGTFDPLTRAR